MIIIFFITTILSASMVQIQFDANLDKYLTLYEQVLGCRQLPIFTASTLIQIKEHTNRCSRAALRQIDNQIFEFYFCGFKMCLDRCSDELKVCIDEEHNTKWEMQKLDLGRKFALRNNNFCVTLRNNIVVMEPCREGVAHEQILNVIPIRERSKFFVSDDFSLATRKKLFKSNLKDNENIFRMESIFFG